MNVFVSVGTQLPFDRLLQMVDEAFYKSEHNVVFQTAESSYKPISGLVYKYLDPVDYNDEFNKCDIFISHAGMGSIITALENSRYIIIVPRRFELGEHRNDHQISTAQKFSSNDLVYVANDINELVSSIEKIHIAHKRAFNSKPKPEAQLIEFLRGFING